ncbi:MAG: four helix bundle protein [Gemmataceae bacterium]
MSVPQKPQEIRERVFHLALRIIRLCQWLDQQRGVPRTLGSQLLRSGTSIGANLEEAQAAYSRAEYHYRVSIALREARETTYWLRLLIESQIVTADRLQLILEESTAVMKILGAILSRSRKKGDS